MMLLVAVGISVSAVIGYILFRLGFYIGNQMGQTQHVRDHLEETRQTVASYAEQYKLGKRSLLDLLDSENEFFSSRTAYVQAEYAYATTHGCMRHVRVYVNMSRTTT